MSYEAERGTKEATILSQALAIRSLLRDFQAELDRSFKRDAAGGAAGEDRPIAPNVLDEILEELEMDKAYLSSLLKFIVAEVLPKIH